MSLEEYCSNLLLYFEKAERPESGKKTSQQWCSRGQNIIILIDKTEKRIVVMYFDFKSLVWVKLHNWCTLQFSKCNFVMPFCYKLDNSLKQ